MVTELKPIRTEADYDAALAEVEKLWGAKSGTPEGDRLDILATLIDAYEAKHYPMDPPDPIEAIRFRMEQQGITRKDLEPMIGTRARVAEGLHLGLPNHWFPILYSSELGKDPIQVRRFGEDLAVWRDSAGQPHVFEGNCPHRGAPLALGRIRGDELACWYHGWSYNAEGACTWTPLEEPGCARVARIRLKTYPTVERAGFTPSPKNSA